MKSIKTFALMGAVALIGSVGFSSCEQKNKPENQSGEYNGETVKTEFLINIAENVAGSGNASRFMPGATVQKGQDIASFRGMDNIRLIPYRNNDYSARIGKTISLQAITVLNSTSQSKLYTDVSIPLGTENFLFYGKAIDNTAETDITTVSDKHQFGHVKVNGLYSGNPEIGGISFDLDPIYASGAIDAKATALATYLTSIANAKDGSNAWADHANAGIKQLHDDFIRMTAGSSASVQSLVQDLYNTLQRFQSRQVSNDAVVDAVIAAIAAGTDGTGGNISGGSQDPFTEYTVVLENDLQGYPGNINLPDGAAVVTWDTPTANQFNVTATSTMGSMTTSSLAHYAYPVSLQYFAKSTLKTSAGSKATLYTDGTSNWTTILGAYEQGTSVLSNTKSVAIKDPIEYGVGQLAVNVKHTAALLDQKGETYTITHPLKWKAVLVGGQKQVDYQFECVTSATNVYTIYDNFLNGVASPATPVLNGEVEIGTEFVDSKENYTLVFGTKDNGDGNDPLGPGSDAVYVAIEMVNTNDAFYGVGGQIIPAGGTFYLVGKLDASVAANVDKTNHPTNYNIFYKDYVTKANFTITSLENAYNTIPDLRSHQLELGFSVDLAWKNGLVFNINL